jgi:hypothetical protein
MVIMQINRFLIRIDDTKKRSFYESEAVVNYTLPEGHKATVVFQTGLTGSAGVPSKVHNRQLVKIQPEERLATTSELKPHTRSGNRLM